jgi:uncharacterized protein (DUF924 family)
MSPSNVLSFWFGPADPAHPDGQQRAQWWKTDKAFDDAIRTSFFDTWTQAVAGELDGWQDTPEGTLALVIVLDQFSRNLFRGDPRSWTQDPAALAITQSAIERGDDERLTHFGRQFLYMPLMHSEDRAVQIQSIEAFDKLNRLAPPSLRSEGTPRYAVMHKDIVDRFGRYPHRNTILGRESTAEELEFLKGPNSSF